MTVKSQIQQVIANAESLHGQLQAFALETQDQDVKQMYQKMSSAIDEMLPHLKGRLSHMQDAEFKH